MKMLTEIVKMIDHSLLHPTYTDEVLRSGCIRARELNVASVCIKPYAVEMAKEVLSGSSVKIGTVVGFPHGSSHIKNKIEEAESACRQGAEEIDFVVNIGKVLSRDWDYVSQEIHLINEMVVSVDGISKVIFENDFYDSDDYKIELCKICNKHRVAFVKTSTGYGFVKQKNGSFTYEGATDHDLTLMRNHCSPDIHVKAAGGIKTLNDVLRVKKLGATRVGASATETIVKEAIEAGYR